MTLRAMIDAARAGNAAEVEKNFTSIVNEKLGAALSARKTEVVSSMFGLQTEEKHNEDEDDVEKED